MNILLAGKLDSTAVSLSLEAGKNKTVLVTKKSRSFDSLPQNARNLVIGEDCSLINRVLKTNSFDIIVFFMARGEHGDKSDGTLDELRIFLEKSETSDIKKFVLVSSGEVYNGLDNRDFSENTTPYPMGLQGNMLMCAELMCFNYAKKNNSQVVILRLPYVYHKNGDGDGLVSRFFAAAAEKKNSFELPGLATTRCDFLSDTDVARLIWVIIDGDSFRTGFVNAAGTTPMTFADFAKLCSFYFPEMNFFYNGDVSDPISPMRLESAKDVYGWMADGNLRQDFLSLFIKIPRVPVRRSVNWFKTVKDFKVFILLEFIAGTALLKLMTDNTGEFSMFNFDFRLLFVVVMGYLHGIFAGLAAAVIACASYFLSMDQDWQILLHNSEKWVPFALYITVGIVLGYSTVKERDERKTIDEKLSATVKMNTLLNGLFDEAVSMKEQYRDQILGYKNSFGRIYSIVQKLNTEMPENIFSSSIEALEDILQNYSIVIYGVSGDNRFGRTVVSSKSLPENFPRSLKLNELPGMMKQLAQREIWFNRDLLHGYPVYAAPIYNENDLIGIIAIHHALRKQMTLQYSNLLKIMTGLIQEALVRASKFNKARERELYYPDTRMMLNVPFSETLMANVALTEQERAGFRILAIRSGGSYSRIVSDSELIESCVRESDVFGIINDDLYGVILKNSTPEGVQAVITRIKNAGKEVEEITTEKALNFINGDKNMQKEIISNV